MNKDILQAVGFGKMVDNIEHGKCPTCGKGISLDAFKDDLSRKEFKISGMCQKCQDSIFNEPDHKRSRTNITVHIPRKGEPE